MKKIFLSVKRKKFSLNRHEIFPQKKLRRVFFYKGSRNKLFLHFLNIITKSYFWWFLKYIYKDISSFFQRYLYSLVFNSVYLFSEQVLSQVVFHILDLKNPIFLLSCFENPARFY